MGQGVTEADYLTAYGPIGLGVVLTIDDNVRLIARLLSLALQRTISHRCMTDQFLVSWAPLGVNVNSAALLTPLVLVQRFWVTGY